MFLFVVASMPFDNVCVCIKYWIIGIYHSRIYYECQIQYKLWLAWKYAIPKFSYQIYVFEIPLTKFALEKHSWIIMHFKYGISKHFLYFTCIEENFPTFQRNCIIYNAKWTLPPTIDIEIDAPHIFSLVAIEMPTNFTTHYRNRNYRSRSVWADSLLLLWKSIICLSQKIATFAYLNLN